MLDSIQILLIVVISILTVLLTFIGVEIYQILKEFRRGLKKFNGIIEDAHTVSSSVAEPVSEARELFHGLKKGATFVKHISDFFKEEKGNRSESKKSDDYDEEEDNESSEPKKHFFNKKGKSLGK